MFTKIQLCIFTMLEFIELTIDSQGILSLKVSLFPSSLLITRQGKYRSTDSFILILPMNINFQIVHHTTHNIYAYM